MTKKELTITRIFDATREELWRAWTDPKALAQWWSPRGFTTPTVEIDAKVGGELYIVMQAGENLGAMSGMKAPMKGVFTEVVEGTKLTFTNNALDESGNVLLSGTTEVTFEDDGGPPSHETSKGQEKTKMTVHTGAEGDGPNTDMMLGGMEQGWNEQLDKLGEFLQK